MSFKSNYKVRKSKLLYCLPVNKNNSSYEDIEARQHQVIQMTHSLIGQSKRKFRTVNYKKYDYERKLQIQKRKQSQKPLSLYLDGGNPPLRTQYPDKFRKNTNQGHYFKQLTKPIDIIPRQSQNYQASKVRKTLRSIILKQISIKNQLKEQNQKYLNINNASFDNLQDLFVLKKINKITSEKRAEMRTKQQMGIDSSRQLSQIQNYKTNIKSSAKFPIFTERVHQKIKNKKQLSSPERQLSQRLLPSVQQKSHVRPLIFLSANDSKKILSQSYIVLKYPENKIVSGIAFRKNAQIASLTKIMTFYTILSICKENEINYRNRVVQIGETAQQMTGTTAEIFEGQKYTLQQLFYALMLPSGNDAAVAIANQGGFILKEHKNEKINLEEQSIKCFIKYMNLIAKNIGMKTTTFANPHGLPNYQNCSNPYQLAILISECIKFDEFINVTGTKTYSFWISDKKNKRQVKWENTHKLLKRQGFIGGKTGVTVTAGPCLASIYKTKHSQIFITVVLRAPKLSRRFKQTRLILGLSLKNLDPAKYVMQVKSILKSNTELDSDNSSDQQAFDFSKSDSVQMRKRNKILVYEM